jgi:hypothetical protein
MPVHRQKKCTTADSTDSTEGQSAPALPDQQEFHQHLRELARRGMRIVLEAVMREELDALIGVAWGRAIPSAKGIATAPTPATWSRPLVGSRS